MIAGVIILIRKGSTSLNVATIGSVLRVVTKSLWNCAGVAHARIEASEIYLCNSTKTVPGSATRCSRRR